MKRLGIAIAGFFILYIALLSCNNRLGEVMLTTDVLVIGGGASGTTAGIQSARLGVKTLIVEEFDWLGGMLTSAGVSAIDGNYRLHSGLWEEFRQKLYQTYGGQDAVNTGWVSNVLFEPSVGDSILKSMVTKEKNLSVVYNSYATKIEKGAGKWIVTFQKKGAGTFRVHTKMVIDATELGDVTKMAGIQYRIGMDSKKITGEEIALDKPRSIIQDITYVAILKDYGPNVDKTIPKPEGYNAADFYKTCAGKVSESDRILWPLDKMMTYGKLPNGKYMINWPIYGNDYYLNVLEMSRDEREEALKEAKLHTLKYIYYLQNELGFKNLGLADNEFQTADLLPYMPYYRESRRVIGEALFTLRHISKPYDQPEKLYRTGVVVGDYAVDHHHSAYSIDHVFPDIHFYPVPSYCLPLGVMIPKNSDNFIVAEKSISVSNIANGTTRLQPVCLLIGQAAGALAASAVKEGKSPKDVSVRSVQSVLLDYSAYIQPYIDVQPGESWFKAAQKIGATGILRGVGKNNGWANETWFYPDSLVRVEEVTEGIKDYWPGFKWQTEDAFATFGETIELLDKLNTLEKSDSQKDEINSSVGKILADMKLPVYSNDDFISRKAFAVLLDSVIDPFGLRDVNLQGELINKKP
uniref:FAD-dependent oxidoreductase n=1 Tax=uncultured Draconibacterium sp. TaxID=1573823 RepID=UPI00321793D9